jgi:hypothetical protein
MYILNTFLALLGQSSESKYLFHFALTHSSDGTFNGEPSPQGMYSYKIWYNPSGDGHGTGDSPRSIEKMGSVMVVR